MHKKDFTLKIDINLKHMETINDNWAVNIKIMFCFTGRIKLIEFIKDPASTQFLGYLQKILSTTAAHD